MPASLLPVVLLLVGAHASAPPPRTAAPAHAPPAAGHAHHGGEGHRGPHDATVSHRFDDVEHWVKVFDDPGRDEWQKPREVVAALGLQPGDVVADIGAGTGYFEPYLSRAVGETGAVIAADVEPGLVAHLRERAEREGTHNVIPVLASFDNPRLPPGACDVVLIVDTYHHVNDRIGYFTRLKAALAPGGRVVIVDFNKGPRPVGPPPDHALAKEEIVAEMRRAGYELASDLGLLPYQYLLTFAPRP